MGLCFTVYGVRGLSRPGLYSEFTESRCKLLQAEANRTETRAREKATVHKRPLHRSNDPKITLLAMVLGSHS